MLNLDLYLSEPIKRALFRVCDFMLQNSGREPFGLVGLEVMAAGGLVFTGSTGEEYARHGKNAVVLDTEDAHEIASAVIDLLSRPAEMEAIRSRAVRTAAEYTWTHVVEQMRGKLRYLAAGRERGPAEGC
jgi:glycosyltransferase involved in cell wall biosynthesis